MQLLADCSPQSSRSHCKSLRRSNLDDAADTQQSIQATPLAVTGGDDSRHIHVENSSVITDTESVTEETLSSHYSVADNNHSQHLSSEDQPQTYDIRHHNQKDNSDIPVDHHSCVDSSLLSESSAGNENDSSSIPLLNVHDSQHQQWEGQSNLSTEDGVSPEMSAEDRTADDSEQNVCHRSKSPVTMTVTADVHARPPESPPLSPPLFSDSSFAVEDRVCSRLLQSEEESAEEVEQVGN